ncbi:hypothetical protein WA026_013105 [Henosepilachna vigintioctopunctata]|uniref:Uncharacterized protein n=1 Tax=Henosepilachna vigintioctopunctata TaxID=420089 RepID=A0AAW1UJA7_9CUCU
MTDLNKLMKELRDHFDKVTNNIGEVIVNTIVDAEYQAFKKTCNKEFEVVLEKLIKGSSLANILKSGKKDMAWNKVKSEYCSALHKAKVAANQSLDSQIVKARSMIEEICERSTHDVNALQGLIR